MPTPTLRQLDIFGVSHLVRVPTSGEAIPVGPAPMRCGECGDLETPHIIGTVREYDHVTYEYVARNVWGVCCDQLCQSCHGTTTYGICERCEQCEDCCECDICEHCGERCEEACPTCHNCDRHCDCYICECGERVDTNYGAFCGECDSCERCCECADVDDCEDCETVTTYTRGDATGTRTFGVELEHSGIGPQRAAAALRANGLVNAVYRGYTHSHCEDWKTVTDSSVYDGGEAVSGILRGADGFRQLEVACTALLANGADVSSNCGTHVHIGCEDLTAADLLAVARFYDAQHGIIDLLHAPSRRGTSSWSGPHGAQDLARAAKMLADGDETGALHALTNGTHRYRSVNLTAWAKYRTIEFRQHGGTLNAAKLSAWVRFLFALIAAAQDGAQHSATLEGLLDVLAGYGLSSEDRTYLLARAEDLRQNV